MKYLSSSLSRRPPGSTTTAASPLPGYDPELSGTVADHITRTAHGMEQRLREAFIDLRSQAGDVHVDDISLRIKMIVPDVLQQHSAGHDLAGVAHQIFEQAEFPRLQLDLLS